MTKDRPSEPASVTPSSAKLTVKVGDSEVHLEARPEVVREELGRVLDRLFQPADSDAAAIDQAVVSVTASRPAPVPTPPATEAPPAAEDSTIDAITRARGRQMLEPNAIVLLRHATLDPEQLTALYSVDPTGQVYLQTPARTADRLENTMRLLLYGALVLRGSASVNGRFLLHGARSLGFKLVRVPRDFARDGKLAAIHGRHRSKTYRLTAAGIRHCEALIPGLLRIVE